VSRYTPEQESKILELLITLSALTWYVILSVIF